MKKWKWHLVVISIILFPIFIFSGCSKTEKETTADVVKKSTYTGPKELRLSSKSDEGLNPHINTSQENRILIGYISGGLYDLQANEDRNNIRFVPYHAKELPITSDHKVWTFKIREGLKFADGTPINAKTYEYSWKMLLDPKLINDGARVLFDNIAIINAKNYFKGKVTWGSVGIKSIDDYTLEITTETAVPTIDILTTLSAGGPLSPVHEKLYEKYMKSDRSATSYGTIIEAVSSSGTYRLTEWVKDQYKVFEKNNEDLMASVYHADKIYSKIAPDPASRLKLFENKEVDSVSISGNNFDKFADDGKILRDIDNTIWGYYINSLSEKNAILKNQDFRKAIYYGIPREVVAKSASRLAKPVGCFISSSCYAGDPANGGMRYGDSEQAKSLIKGNGSDTALAKQYFNKAYANNGNRLVSIEIIYIDGQESMRHMAQITKEELEKLFGKEKLEVRLKGMSSTAAYQAYYEGNYDLGIGYRTQNVFNPWSSMIVWSSTFPQKIDTFYNKDFDYYCERTTKGDLMLKDKERADALFEMEKMLVDYVPFVPLFQNTINITHSDRFDIKTDSQYLPGVGFAISQAEITAEK